MRFILRAWLAILVLCWFRLNSAAAEQRILFNIFNVNCQRRDFGKKIAVDNYGTIYLIDDISANPDPNGGGLGRVERFNYNGRHAGFLVRDANPNLLGPGAVALDRSGAGYLANVNQLYRFQPYPDARLTPFIELTGTVNDLTVDAGGTIHALQDQRIVRIGSTGNVIATFDVPLGAGGPVIPEGMDTDAGRNVYLADYRNHRVIRLNPDGQFSFLTHETELQFPKGLAVGGTPLAEEILVGVGSNHDEIARFAPDGHVIGRFPLDAEVRDIDVDSYGSIYVLVLPGFIQGIDPDISPDSLVTAARAVVLPGHPLDGSTQGEYFKGLAVRAGRTSGNFVAVTEARRRLEALRAEAQYTESLQEDPVLADRISRSLEQINGFLTAVESYSPITVGEDCDPVMAPNPVDPIDILEDSVEFLLGGEPFYGRYRSSTPIGLPLPPRIEMTLDTSTATSSFIKPGAWGGDNAITGLVRPEVISSNIAIDIGPTGATVAEFSSEFGTIDINGTASGVNHARLAPNGQVFSTFGLGQLGTLEFEAHAEGIITNDLYPESRPIFTFADLQGYQGIGGRSAAVYGTNEPMVVPGAPGGPPTELPGIAFIATRVSFDPANGQLRFRENTNPGDAPDISVILTPDGVFAGGGIGTGEPAAGAAFALDPLVFTGFNLETGRFEFSDATFRIAAGETTLASGQLTDIGIDAEQFLFTASLALDDLPPGVDSPFLDALAANLPQIVLLTPDATAHLLRGSDNFNSAYQSPTHLMVIAALVPEPSAMMLIALGSAYLFFLRLRMRT
jgi:hypothetical protein